MTTTKFFSSVEPRQSDRPQARQFVVGDEWHNNEVVKVWDGSAWKEPTSAPKDEDEETEVGAGDDGEATLDDGTDDRG